MKYTLVYRDRPSGYNWSAMNQDGLYAGDRGNKAVLNWRTSMEAVQYMEAFQVWGKEPLWVPWPDEKPAKLKRVTTAASYKPAHGSYPQPASSADLRVHEAIAAGWSSKGTVTGRIPSSQPLVWPVIPQYDDGSNEEATTVPDVLVSEMTLELAFSRYYNFTK